MDVSRRSFLKFCLGVLCVGGSSVLQLALLARKEEGAKGAKVENKDKPACLLQPPAFLTAQPVSLIPTPSRTPTCWFDAVQGAEPRARWFLITSRLTQLVSDRNKDGNSSRSCNYDIGHNDSSRSYRGVRKALGTALVKDGKIIS